MSSHQEISSNDDSSRCTSIGELPSSSESTVDYPDNEDGHQSVPINAAGLSTVDRNMCVPRKAHKQKQTSSNQAAAIKIPKNYDNRKAFKKHSKKDCPFCGVTLMYKEFNDHIEIHTLDLFTFKKSRKRSQNQEQHPLHKKEFAMVLKQRCERPQAHYLSPKSELICPFCKIRFVWKNDEGKIHAKEHLESCREKNLKISFEILKEVPSGSSAVEDSDDINDINISSDYLGSDMLRITGSDENEILDIENDDTVLYGPNQYSDQDVIPLGIEGTENLQAAVSSSNSDNNDDGNGTSSVDGRGSFSVRDESEDEKELGEDDFSCIESLKRKQRESDEIRGALCPVCMDEFRTPLTAIGCWHVLCESCWLTALTVKKICPVCKTIVSSDALRRVYL